MILKQIKVKIQMIKLIKSQYDIYQMVINQILRLKTMALPSFPSAGVPPLILK